MAGSKRKELPSVVVDDDTLAAIDKGLESMKTGRKWTLEEAMQFARERRKEWAKKPGDQKSA